MRLTNSIQRLSAYEPDGQTFISVYLDTAPDQTGTEPYDIWLKTQTSDAIKTFPEGSPEAGQFEAAVERIRRFLSDEKDESARGVAIFTNTGDETFFETVQIDEPFPQNLFVMSDRPHIFPIVRLIGQNPKYAVIWADTNKADIYVFGGENHLDVETDTRAKIEEIQGEKTRRTHVGGWSQARYQRHIANFHLQHAKETVDELEKLMRQSNIEYLILCGDEATMMPVLRPQLSKEFDEKVVAVLNMSQYASEEEIREKTHEAMTAESARRNAECVQRVFDAARAAAGLGTLGVEKTLAALSNGQVEELVLSADLSAIRYNSRKVEKVLEEYAVGDDNSTGDDLPEVTEKDQIADELIARALNSAAKITFVEDEALLREAGGVGAVLRYNMNATAAT